MPQFAVKFAGRTSTENRYEIVETEQEYTHRIYAAMAQGKPVPGENLLTLEGAHDLRPGEFVKVTKTGRVIRAQKTERPSCPRCEQNRADLRRKDLLCSRCVGYEREEAAQVDEHDDE